MQYEKIQESVKKGHDDMAEASDWTKQESIVVTRDVLEVTSHWL